MASCSKRRRTDEEPGNIFDISSLKEYVLKDLLSQLDTLCLLPHKKAVTLRPLKILNCNATDGQTGVRFSKAYCSVKAPPETFLFGDIFRHGLKLIVDFVKDPERKLPSDKHDKHILCKLMRFINTDAQETFEDIGRLEKTELSTLLANHLLGKLTMSCDYIIDKNCEKYSKDKCHCGEQNCKLTGNYGDTSIGNGGVWHGNVDIVVNNDVGVALIEDKQDSPGGKSSIKLKSTNLSRNSQIIAETIVFSFLQKRRHPANNHFLTPFIGVGNSEMVIMLYDAEHDVLLESSCIPLMENIEDGVSKLSLGAIIVLWLVVNYKYLCDGLTDDMKSFMKAEFFNQAEKKISIYESNLKFQNVDTSTLAAENSNIVQVDRILSSDFTYELHMEIGKYLYNKSD